MKFVVSKHYITVVAENKKESKNPGRSTGPWVSNGYSDDSKKLYKVRQLFLSAGIACSKTTLGKSPIGPGSLTDLDQYTLWKHPCKDFPEYVLHYHDYYQVRGFAEELHNFGEADLRIEVDRKLPKGYSSWRDVPYDLAETWGKEDRESIYQMFVSKLGAAGLLITEEEAKVLTRLSAHDRWQ